MGKKVGEILIDNGMLDETKLHQSLEIQKTDLPRQLIGEILIQMNYVAEDDVQIALAVQSLESKRDN